MTEPGAAELAAIVLAGGRGARLGGVDKPALELDGVSLVGRVVAAARDAGAAPMVVVGPDRPGVDAVFVREDPPFGGPVAGLAVGLPLVRAEWVLVLAADLRRPVDAVRALAAAGRGDDGALLVDGAGHPQWLSGLYRRTALADALEALGDPVGAAMGRLLSGLRLVRHPIADDVVADIDTPADARDAGIAF